MGRGMELRWVRQQVGMFVAFDRDDNEVGYVLDRGTGYWTASADGIETTVRETAGEAKGAVVDAILAHDEEAARTDGCTRCGMSGNVEDEDPRTGRISWGICSKCKGTGRQPLGRGRG